MASESNSTSPDTKRDTLVTALTVVLPLGFVLGGVYLVWRLMRDAKAQEIETVLTQDVRIPFRVRKWAPQVALAAARTVPSGWFPVQWARLLMAIMDRESGGDLNVVGGVAPNRDFGLMQLNEKWNAKWLAANDPFDPWKNTARGAEVLRDKINALSRLVGNWSALDTAAQVRAFVAAYNTGEGNVRNSLAAGQDVDSTTTNQNYSADVLRRGAQMGLDLERAA